VKGRSRKRSGKGHEKVTRSTRVQEKDKKTKNEDLGETKTTHLGETKKRIQTGRNQRKGQTGRNQRNRQTGRNQQKNEKNFKPVRAREGTKPSSREETRKEKDFCGSELCRPWGVVAEVTAYSVRIKNLM
jgi:hypothetical protein